MNLKSIFIVLLFSIPFSLNAQDYDGFKGKSAFQPYDKTYINPSFRGKHSTSLGIAYASLSPIKEFNGQLGAHLGYNYLIFYKRRRFFGIKEVYRDELKMGFGLNMHYFFNGEWFLAATYSNPTFSLKAKLLSFYFFNEFGFGIHRAPQKLDDPAKVKFNVSLEFLRIRFGKSPLNICFNAHYDAGSALLSKDRMDLAFSTKLSYYIYKKYDRYDKKQKKGDKEKK